MRSRIATVATLLALVGGTGGALAVAHSDHGNPYGGAGSGQYRPGKGCGDRHHHHHHHHHHHSCPPPRHHHYYYYSQDRGH